MPEQLRRLKTVGLCARVCRLCTLRGAVETLLLYGKAQDAPLFARATGPPGSGCLLLSTFRLPICSAQEDRFGSDEEDGPDLPIGRTLCQLAASLATCSAACRLNSSAVSRRVSAVVEARAARLRSATSSLYGFLPASSDRFQTRTLVDKGLPCRLVLEPAAGHVRLIAASCGSREDRYPRK